MHFILISTYRVFSAWIRSVQPKHLAYIDGTDKIGCGCRLYVYQFVVRSCINTLKTKRRPLYLKTQSVPRCKHFSSWL
jgi:hypothetical protein